MKDAQGDPAYGRTNWRRFAVAVGVPTVVAGGLVVALANGALAASFSVSGTQFKLTATELDGTGFTQYAGTLPTASDNPNTKGRDLPAAMSGIRSADITDLCQSVAAGPLVLRIEAGGGGKPAHADNLLIGMSELGGDATFENINIGADANHISKDGRPEGSHGAPGTFGQEADTVNIKGLKQKAYSTQASTFVLNGMTLKLFIGDNSKECYQG